RASMGQSTPLAARDAQALLGNAWFKVVGSSPNPRAVAILTAHWALETDGGRCMPGHNFAGIKASPEAPGAELRTVEGHGAGQREVIARFRSYDSAQAGAQDYVHLLATRYPAALSAADAGNAPAFVHALAHGGYFTADPQAYGEGLVRRLHDLEHGHASSAHSASASFALAQVALAGILHAFQPPAEDT
ncbi:MAG TPA: glucosaminidase domain-containing protein, partial [Polyangiaceae bacterium]|nr:glucosaminidase domain-containing protein [Polyangiaceae bacterium]